jgi:hypothetical protein
MFTITKSELIEGIIVAIILFLLLIIILYMYSSMCTDVPVINKNIANIKWRTGDILTVSYKHLFGKFISAWSRSIMSHPAVVCVLPNGSIEICEAAYYNQDYKHIVRLPLEKWLEYNKAHDIFYTAYNGPTISSTFALKKWETFKKYKLDRLNKEWIRLLRVEDYKPMTEDRYVCYELTIGYLQELGIVSKKHSANSYWPSDIAYGRLHYENGINYRYPVQIEK